MKERVICDRIILGDLMLNFKIDDLSVWEKLQETTEPIIMYGTGNGADKVVDILEALNIKLSGITASNGFVRKRFFRDFPVKPLEYFEEKYKSFTIIITFGTSLPDVMENIFNISEKHRILVPCVPVIGTEIFDRSFLEKHTEEINLAHSLLADDFSRKIFESYVNFQFGGKIEILKEIETSESEIYENVLTFNNTECFVDIGAYRGDTVEKFVAKTNGKYRNIIAAEPDFKTYQKLIRNCESLNNFKAVNAAITGFDGEIGFSSLAGRQSSVGGENMINCLSLPTLCQDVKPTFIKIDSEGCEIEILKGGEEILKKFKPKLNVAAYHKSEDIFKLPILINAINPDYKIHLRHHPYIPAWDTLFYCI
ncbi:MAG: FkbM family methyltransferase [Clostridia bacterium]|nr:FkbM family methyltransferase [Clostridia bacterium]